MSPAADDFEYSLLKFAKILTPFFVINLISSVMVVLQPLAMPIFLAEFCLLAIWSAWGPGCFWRRFGIALGIGALFFFTALYLWIVLLTVSKNPRIILILLQWLFSIWILVQIPLWCLRFIWQWRITSGPDDDLQAFSVGDCLIGITMIGFALGSYGWATDHLIDAYGPFGYEHILSVYAWTLLEFYLLIGLATLGTYLTFRLRSRAAIIVPMLIYGFAFALVTASLWFPFPERWIVAGATWLATILFSWAVICPLRAIQRLGLVLYRGRVQIGA